MIALCGVFTVCHAQQTNTIIFSYDLNGNRVLRQIVIDSDEKANNEMTSVPAAYTFETISLTLFPNPTKGKFYISINGLNTATALRATITTNTGAIVCDKPICSPSEDFDLTQQPAGIYLLCLTSSCKSHTWKIIKE